jgi:hypothetical protein
MITKAFEWLRVANPQGPTSEEVTARTATVEKLIAEFRESADLDLLADFCVAVVLGVSEFFANNSDFVKSLVEHIRADQAAFPASVEENGLELRIVAALTLGQLLSEKATSGNVKLRDLAAMMLVSLFENRANAEVPHLAAIANELSALAHAVLEKAARRVRKRNEIDIDALGSISATGDALWTALQPALTKLFREFADEAHKNREELELLWWMFNGYSNALSKPVDKLSVDEATVACGSELATRAILPPSAALAAMVEDAVTRSRTPTQLAAKPLQQCVSKWTAEIQNCVVLDDEQISFAKNHPLLLPFTWIVIRLKEGGGAARWNEEFTAKTGLAQTTELSKAQLARQVFFEYCCLRMISDFPAEEN